MGVVIVPVRIMAVIGGDDGHLVFFGKPDQDIVDDLLPYYLLHAFPGLLRSSGVG